MPLPLTEENAEKGFCAVLACTGIGAATDNCDSIRKELIRKIVPESMLDTYSARLLACANTVCGNEPYRWTVVKEEPAIEDKTTFDDLWNGWFIHIVFE